MILCRTDLKTTGLENGNIANKDTMHLPTEPLLTSETGSEEVELLQVA